MLPAESSWCGSVTTGHCVLCCNNARYSSTKTPVGVLSWTCWTQGKWPSRRDWRAKQPAQVACVSDDLQCWGVWDTTRAHKGKGITPSIVWWREAQKKTVTYNISFWQARVVIKQTWAEYFRSYQHQSQWPLSVSCESTWASPRWQRFSGDLVIKM